MKQAAFLSVVLVLLQAPVTSFAQSPAGKSDRPLLPLKDAVRDALHLNLTLRSARSTTAAEETAVMSARGAFDPRLSAEPSYSTGRSTLLLDSGASTSGSQSGRALSAGVSGSLPFSTGYAVNLDHTWRDQENPLIAGLSQPQPAASTNLVFSLRQPLLKGAGPRYAQAPVTIAEYARDAARARLDRTVEETIAGVETAYWSVGLAEEVERLSFNSYLRAKELLDRNERMRGLGLISDVDLITAKRGVQARLTSLTEATRRRKDAVDRLLFYIYGEKAGAVLERLHDMTTDSPPEALPPLLGGEETKSLAMSIRTDVKAFSLDRSQSSFSEILAKNALLPDVSLAGSVSTLTEGTNTFRLLSTQRAGDIESTDWRIGLVFSYPLSNRGARAAHAKAKFDAEASALALTSAQANAESELRIAKRAVESTHQRLRQARLSFDLAGQQYEAGQKQLQLGLIDSFRLLQMEDDVTTAELVLAQVRYDLAQSITSYELATDGLRKKYEIAPETPPQEPVK